MTTLQTVLTVAATATANATLQAGKHTPVDATSGPLTMTLPTPATIGARLRVEKVDSSANTVTVSGTIRGTTATIGLASQYQSVELVAESLSSWRPAAGYTTGGGGGVPTSRAINTTAPLAGGGTLAGDLTLTVGDATTGAKGVVQLAGDLAGTAAAPTVPGLAGKANDSAVVHNTGNETVGGTKTFSAAPVVPAGAFPESAVANLGVDLAARAVYRGAWAPSTVYAVNDLVIIGGELLICKTAHTSGSGFALTNWTVLTAGPHIYNVLHYGAVGDGKIVNDGVMNSGSAVLTSATANFTGSDVGKAIMVKGAAATGITTLVTTIASWQSSTQVTLAATAATSVTGAYVLWATDDTAAIQAALNAAQAYGSAHGFAQTYVPVAPAGLFYGVAGSLIKGGATKGNAQLTISPVDPAIDKVTLDIVGAGNGSACFHWQQHVPQTSGSTLVSFGVASGISARATDVQTNGNPALIGCPTQPYGYGTNALLFSNMLVTLRNLSLVNTYSTYGLTYSAADFSGVAEANIFDVTVGVASTYGDLQSPNSLSSSESIGILMPANGNNDNNAIRNLSIMGGYTHGIYATEHTVINALRVLYCWSAVDPIGVYFTSVGASHAVYIDAMSCEGCNRHVNIVGSGQSGIGPTIYIGQLDTEGNPIIYDGSNNGAGGFGLGDIAYTGYNAPSVPNPTGIKLRNLLQQPGWVPTPSYTLGTPFMNNFFRDATVTLSGGTVTGVRVGRSNAGVAALGGSSAPTMQSVWTGALSAPLTLRIPAGGWLAIDGSVAPTSVWILD